jgi:hypothetical protein
MYIIHGASGKHRRLIPTRPNVNLRLSFVQQEVFGNLILSLNKIRKRLMVSSVFDPFKMVTLIDISKIKCISIKKEYRDIQRGTTIRKNLEEFLEKMSFRFEFFDNVRILSLPIFELNENTKVEIENIEKRAVIWQLLLSKLKLQ